MTSADNPSLPPPFRDRRPLLWAAGGFLIGVLAAAAVWLHHRPASPFPDQLLTGLSLVRRADGVHVSDVSGLSRAEVLAVVDGDTLRIRRDGREDRLRYYGVDTPERDEACYGEATARNAALAGREVLLAFDERLQDKYGRLLAYVFTPDGRSVDAALVGEGFGRAWTRNGRWRDGMEALEKEAREAKRGCLWGKEGAPAPRRRARAHKKK